MFINKIVNKVFGAKIIYIFLMCKKILTILLMKFEKNIFTNITILI